MWSPWFFIKFYINGNWPRKWDSQILERSPKRLFRFKDIYILLRKTFFDGHKRNRSSGLKILIPFERRFIFQNYFGKCSFIILFEKIIEWNILGLTHNFYNITLNAHSFIQLNSSWNKKNEQQYKSKSLFHSIQKILNKMLYDKYTKSDIDFNLNPRLN